MWKEGININDLHEVMQEIFPNQHLMVDQQRTRQPRERQGAQKTVSKVENAPLTLEEITKLN